MHLILEIDTPKKAISALKDIIELDDEKDIPEIDWSSSSNWASFSLQLTGENFHGTVPVDIMRGLVEYQTALNSAVASILSVKKLDVSLRRNIELIFGVENCCSNLKASTEKTISAIFEGLTNRMGPKGATICVLTLILCFFGKDPVEKWIAGHYEVLKAQEVSATNADQLNMVKQLVGNVLSNQNGTAKEVIEEAVKQNANLSNIPAESDRAQSAVFKHSKSASSVKFNGIEMSGEAAHHLASAKIAHPEIVEITGQFQVVNIEYNETTTQFSFAVKRNGRDKISGITLGGMLAPNETKEILNDALWNHKNVTIQMRVKKIGGKIKEACLERVAIVK